MATTKKEENEVKTERIFVRREMANSGNSMFISINGVNWLMPVNQYHEVPDYVAEEFHRVERAMNRAYVISDNLKQN